ncbi:UTP--glucose-1-phosphate uridylyltransferase [Dongia deserti]|uniref:UTP--glucose-1-phosphate uridylyltransferase n=1 Tax=Dongia deserti TaxID=2268030 RepID=UPI000E65063D|nr:sugar phosphate nucleotidyltransferase [Dongia deserti]
MATRIRTAVIPAGGLGTRLLPLTRAVPKELLPVWKRPVLDYAMEEAAFAGIERVIIITAPGKEALQTYFADHSNGAEGISIEFVLQEKALGLGDAVRRGAPAGEPIAVLLPDELLIGENCLAQLLDCRARDGGSAIAVKRVARSEVSRYGIVDIDGGPGSTWRVRSVIEKPQPAIAPSDLAVIGRYVLDEEVLERLQDARPTLNGEIQLTDSIAATCRSAGVSAVRYDGRRFDCGNFAGLLEANIAVSQMEQLGPAAERPGAQPRTVSAKEASAA